MVNICYVKCRTKILRKGDGFMWFRSLLVVLTILTVLSKLISGLIILFLDNDLPIISQLFNAGLVVYGIWILIYYRTKPKSYLPFIILFLSEIIIFVSNLFIINFQFTNQWYDIDFSLLEYSILGTIPTMIINLLLILSYFIYFRQRAN